MDQTQEQTQERPAQRLRLLKTGHGDLCLAEWKDNDTETVTLARDTFAREFVGGRMAFRLDGRGLTTPIREFDATAPEIILVPAIAGG